MINKIRLKNESGQNYKHSLGFCEQYFGKIGSALIPNLTNLFLNIDILLNTSCGRNSGSWVLAGSVHNRSANAELRGHNRLSKLASSTCSVHKQTSPPSICWNYIIIKFLK